MEFVFIRHGETLWNLENRMQGFLDSPLTERGLSQAEAIAARLSKEKLNVLYSSDLGRAWQTALCIAETTALTPVAAPEWRERHLGIFEGVEGSELPKRFPAEWQRFLTWDPTFKVPQGESAEEFYERIKAASEMLGRRHPGMKIGIVTHGGVLDIIMRLALDIPLARKRNFSIFNACINSLSWRDGKWKLNTWGDVCHLLDVGAADHT